MDRFLDDRRWSLKKEDIHVLITGQSLGGALSQLSALAFQERFPELKVRKTAYKLPQQCQMCHYCSFICFLGSSTA